MEYFKNWFLMMLFLHEEALPGTQGGAPRFYSGVMFFLRESGICSHIRNLSQKGLEKTVDNARRMMRAYDNPPLITEVPRFHPGETVLFTLTPAGKEAAKELLDAHLTREDRETIKQLIISEFMRR